MAQNLAVGDRVLVPSILIPNGSRQPHSLYRTTVTEVEQRSVRVALESGSTSDLIATSKIHEDVGLAVVSIGDFSTETALIDPLRKSALQFCRLLLPDDSVTAQAVRSLRELKRWWSANHGAQTHIILIGHGSTQGVTFGVDGLSDADALGDALACAQTGRRKTVISLCCETGKNPFAADLSNFPWCEAFIAPFHSVHGAVASQFLQTFLGWHLLQGASLKIAFRNANEAAPGGNKFKLWIKGRRQ